VLLQVPLFLHGRITSQRVPEKAQLKPMFVELTHGDRTIYGDCGRTKKQREIYIEK